MANDKLQEVPPASYRGYACSYRRSPFEGIRIPWILNRFLSVEYTTEKIIKILIEMPHLISAKVVINTLTFCKSSNNGKFVLV
jgi:hypothetical protein